MVRYPSPRRALLLSAALVPALWAGVAAAADNSSQTPPQAAATSVGEIVVTATRQEQTLNKVAESVTAFTAAKMDVQGIKSFADVAKFTPGITFDPDSHDIAIRGIESTAGSGTTGIYIDDTPVQVRNLGFNSNNTLPTVFDLDRVEVLRGPQGTLFGAGSEGGTVRYITPQPSLTTYSAYMHSELAYTQDGAPSAEVGVAAGGPIVGDKLGFRVSAWLRRDGGWVDRVDYQTLGVTDGDANRVDTYVLRAALAWTPIENLTITPGIDYQKRDQHNYDDYWVSISNPSADQFLSGTPDRMADPDRFYLATLKVEYDLPAVRIISNTSYYDRLERVNGYSGTLYNLSYFQQIIANGVDPQGNPCTNNCQALYPLLTPTGPNVPGLPNYLAYNLITNTQVNFTQEVRIQSANPDARLNWTAGMFYGQDSQRSTEEIRDPELNQLSEILWDETTLEAWGENLLPGDDDYINSTRGHDRQLALFADATFSITDQLKLEGGLRYAWTHFDFTNFNDGPQDLLDDGGVPATASGSKDERPLTPKVSLSYQATSDDLVYATVAKGYRIGGATPPLPVAACGGTFPDSYNSDSVLSYEIGSKDRFLDRRLYVSASAYYIQWSNIQQNIYVPTCGIQYTANVGDATSKGFDLQAEFRVSHAVELEMTVGYTDATFSKTAIAANGDVLAIRGDSLGAVPWTVTLGAQYNFPLFEQDAFVRADDEFASHRTVPIPGEDPRTTFFDSGLVPDPATNQLSARAGVTFPKWEVELFINNLLNSHPQLDLNHQDQFTTLFEATTFRPRTVGISATVRY